MGVSLVSALVCDERWIVYSVVVAGKRDLNIGYRCLGTARADRTILVLCRVR
jgi:hypothetical protein